MPTLAELLSAYPPEVDVTPRQVREARTGRTRQLVVLDDHASGTQSVAGLPVTTAWSQEDLKWALATGAPGVHVVTGTRAMSATETEDRDFDVTRAALAAADELGVDIDVALRSDSTLRGHYPLETDVVASCLAADADHHIDGLIVCPAFPDAGRITVDSIHYVRGERDIYHPAATTEYAADPAFAFDTSSIPEWIEQRTGGRIAASTVTRMTLAQLRSGIDAVAAILMAARGGMPIVVDAASDSDLRALALALYRAEESGKRFLFRVAPPFIREYLGQDRPATLRGSDIEALREGGRAEGAKHGLVLVGKPAGLTDRQLRELRRRRGLREVEISLPALLDHRRDMHIDEVVARAAQGLDAEHVVLRLSRDGSSGDTDYSLDGRLASGLLAIVRKIVAEHPLRFVVSRGGAIATTVARALGVRRAWVRGPLLPGAVSLWQAEGGPADGVPFAVYAGTIGDEYSLTDVVDLCANVPIPPRQPRLVPPTVAIAPRALQARTAPAVADAGEADSTRAGADAGASETTEAAKSKDAPAASHLAVIGLGATGLPIAACLAETFSVVGFDIAEARRELAWRHGVTSALSAREATDGANLVLLNLRDAAQVADVLFGDDGIAAILAPGAIVVLCSTVGVAEAREIATRLAASDIHLVDAPVSGGPDRARRGELLIAVGAATDALAVAEETLTTLAARIVHVGTTPGDGQAMKIVNQLLAGVQVLATAEALSLARALNLERDAVVDFLRLSDTASFVTTERAERMKAAHSDTTTAAAPVHNPLAVMVKDLGIVASTAYHSGVGVPLAGLTEQMFLLGQRAGWGEADDSVIIRLTEPEERH
ncbi:hypothetical protein BSZ39_11630 [Bowdeniella nasicola]|uniref:3-hydroxyisobutyrate dehydrogenase n=1 Tax=Bowdeniella nasicola TaxID=208480 RepID=A0A1Q5Q088_9ACTO|nr:four-carbon acid sugar kinase family protein [Bowdeniella nasicola]OKL53040.1 hypothetical protein BSZ39_11630 [Bowdeniella nasicola]